MPKQFSKPVNNIAIIGFHGRFPQAETRRQFWANLREGRNCIEPIPEERWQITTGEAPELNSGKWGGFITGVDQFDPLLFRISPKEAVAMDPQQRLFLESVWSTLEDAGYGNHRQNPRHKIGLFVGAMWHDYSYYSHEFGYLQKRYGGPGSLTWAIANRASFIMNFTGPSIALDTACSSSALAVHLACQSLLANECEMAIAGGINLNLHPSKFDYLAHENLLADGPAKSVFKTDSEGYIPGEGVGSILLKPLDKAVADGDHIYAVIKGTTTNHNGGGMFFRVPDSEAQAGLFNDLFQKFDLDPRTISYIEMSAFGSEMVDETEFAGLYKFFHKFTKDTGFCALGTLKPNIGHLEAASGVAQIIKVLLQFHYRKLLPAKFQDPVPANINLEGGPFYLQREFTDWQPLELTINGKTTVIPRRAGINSFGAGGTNVHLVLEEYLPPQSSEAIETIPRRPTENDVLIVFSADQPESLRNNLRRMLEFIQDSANHTSLNLPDLEYTLQIGREPMKERLALIVHSLADLAAKIDGYLTAEAAGDEVFWGTADPKNREAVAADWIEKASFAELAARWVQGNEIDWQQRHQNKERNRIPLPTYAFLRQSYWLDRSHGTASRSQSPADPMTAPDQDYGIKDRTKIYLKELLARELDIATAQLDEAETIWKFGLDSLAIKRLNARLEEHFGKIAATLFFEYQTITELADYLVAEYPDAVQRLYAPDLDRGATRVESLTPVRVQTVAPLYRKSAPVFEPKASLTPIAIIGVSGRYPMAGSLAEFWDNLRTGRDCITEIPQERWDYREYFDPDPDQSRKSYSKWGGFIPDFDKFDPLFFNIPPREAELMDPQERLFLQTVWEAIEDAGYTGRGLRQMSGLTDAPVGVFVGAMWSEYQFYGVTETSQGNPLTPSSALWSIPNRVSYFFNFSGPSIAVDTACSSSLTAIHLACESLRRNECAAAITGGVSLSLHPAKYLYLSQRKFASTDGKCHSFGEGGDGYVPGEGVGTIILKPLSQAIADNDRIYGVIRGSAVSHGGRTKGYSVPNPKAQADLIRNVLKTAQIDPRTIGYIEAHGTGTALGDPIEIEGLTQAFRTGTKDRQFCAIGSLKSNIGHSESAAGIAGVTKVLLQLKYCQLAPSLHSETLNSNIDFANTPFFVQHELGEWKRPVIDGQEIPRRAGISSFGAGGANAHVIIEEYIPAGQAQPPLPTAAWNPVIILLSAKDETRLREQAQRLLAAIRAGQFSDNDLADMAYTLQVGREAMEERLAVVVESMQELEEKLTRFVAGRDNPPVWYRGQVKNYKEALAVFTADEELQEAIDKWIKRRKYAKILDLWVKGLAIDWNKLYGGAGTDAPRPRRIGLPVYPFARERFWIPLGETRHAGMEAVSTTAAVTAEERFGERKSCLLKKQWELDPATPAERSNPALAIFTTQETMELANQLLRLFPKSDLIDPRNLPQPERPENGWKSYDGYIDLIGCGKERIESVSWMEWLQQLIEYGHRDGLILLGVTQGLESFQNTAVNLSGASRAGLYRMLQSEYGYLRSRHMDAAPFTDNKALAEQIAAEVYTESGDAEVCYRNGQRYRSFLEELLDNEESGQDLVFPEGQVLWITGGTRGIGYLCAQHFVTNYGVRCLALTGREMIPAREQWDSYERQNSAVAQKIRAIKALEAKGAQVYISSVSLTDAQAVRESIREVRNTMGPIGGIIHCAGIVDSENPAFIRKSLDGIQQVLNPKVAGLDILYQNLHDEPLKFFILFSSVSAIIPALAPGQSDYAMANAYMDYFAGKAAINEAENRACPVISIQWPSWKETGFGEVKSKAYRQAGLLSHTNAEGLRFLDHILSQKTGPVILPAMVNPNLWNPYQLMHHTVDGASGPGFQPPRPSVIYPPENPDTLTKATENWLADLFCKELKLDPSKLETDKPFQDYGVDSVLLTQLLRAISRLVADDLDPSILYEYPTLQMFASWLASTYASVLSEIWNTPLLKPDLPPAQNSLPPVQSSSAGNQHPKPEFQRRFDIDKSTRGSDIAVVGLSCRFPGAGSLEKYWKLLAEGRCAIRSVPRERWGRPNHYYAGLLDNITHFDPRFFLIPEDDARAMDPQSFLVLEESLNLWYHAGYSQPEIKGDLTGVYLGGRSQHRPGESILSQARNPIVAVGQNYLAANVSQFFDLRGPSLVLDTACSSALTGMNMAVQALNHGEITSALVGGVSLLNTDNVHRLFEQRGILCREPVFYIFDQRAAGVIPGEGVGMVLLKTLDQALEDGDQIYAVIKAISINNDGRTAGPATPNLQAQKDVIQTALAKSGMKAEEISYIEAHGSGSTVTDLIELKAIQAIYRQANHSPCGLGSMKPNIGHPLCAEGIASFIKVVLMLHHRQWVPFLSGEQAMAHFPMESSPFYFCRKPADWPDGPRVAAINCFADGGTNAHVILEAWDGASHPIKRHPIPPPQLERYDITQGTDPVVPNRNHQDQPGKFSWWTQELNVKRHSRLKS